MKPTFEKDRDCSCKSPTEVQALGARGVCQSCHKYIFQGYRDGIDEKPMTKPAQEPRQFWINVDDKSEKHDVIYWSKNSGDGYVHVIEISALADKDREIAELKVELKIQDDANEILTRNLAEANNEIRKDNEQLRLAYDKIKDCESELSEAKRLLNRFCTLSNGLSFYFRSPDENVALRTDLRLRGLSDKLETMYEHQCDVEKLNETARGKV